MKAYQLIFLAMFITLQEIKIENPSLIKSGKHKRSRFYSDDVKAKFRVK